MNQLHKRMLGSILRPLNSIIKVGGDPLDLSSYTVQFQMEPEAGGTAKVAESATGVTKHPTQTFTASATTDLLTCNGHGVQEGDQVIVATQTTLPGGLAASTRYFARDVTPNAFKLAATPGGIALNITDAGTGTHTFYIVGSVQKTFLAADVNTVGRYSAWWTIYSGSDFAAAPVEKQGFIVEIVPFGS
jgi:hypothetical protein